MKNLSILTLIISFIISYNSFGAGKKGLNAVNVKLACKSGNTYTTTLNKDLTFSFKGIDDDCDGATLEFINPNIEKNQSKRPGRAKFSNIILKKGDIAGKGTKSPLYDDKGKEVTNPMYSKSERKSGSIVYFDVTDFVGDIDGDGISEEVCVTLKKTDNDISGKLCGDTSHF
jgi:hypothetical protein